MAEATIAQANAASADCRSRGVKEETEVNLCKGSEKLLVLQGEKKRGDFPFSWRHVNPMWPHSIRWNLGC